MYVDLMRSLSSSSAKTPYNTLSCNLRGYGSGSRPEGVENYYYDFIADDVTALADAWLGGDDQPFHLIGHDHGSALGWYVTARDQKKPVQRVLSYTAMSVPHLDAFSDGLFGVDSADQEQQIGSQYFTVFVMPDSASMNLQALYNTMGRFNKDPGFPESSVFTSADEFQKALWWYNGASDDGGAGILATVPTFTTTELFKMGAYGIAVMRAAYGGESSPGQAQTRQIGRIDGLPTMFVCGVDDAFILCTHEYASNTADYCDDYRQLNVEKCGHDLLACGDDAATKRVIDGIVGFIDEANEKVVNRR